MAKFATHNDQELTVGDTVQVHTQIQEGEKTRVQIFEGILIAVDNRETNKMFRVRKIAAAGVGVERIFPLAAPNILKIVVKKKGQVNRAKLYYLRKRIGKQASKIQERFSGTQSSK